jgi:hypothetical protein
MLQGHDLWLRKMRGRDLMSLILQVIHDAPIDRLVFATAGERAGKVDIHRPR